MHSQFVVTLVLIGESCSHFAPLLLAPIARAVGYSCPVFDVHVTLPTPHLMCPVLDLRSYTETLKSRSFVRTSVCVAQSLARRLCIVCVSIEFSFVVCFVCYSEAPSHTLCVLVKIVLLIWKTSKI